MSLDANLVLDAQRLLPFRAWLHGDIADGFHACGLETNRRLQSAG